MATIPSIAMIPSGYKASKLYSVLPTNGDGDFTTSRASIATRVNENGLLEEVAANVPRLDYSDGGCPSLLLEPTATNLILDSVNGTTINVSDLTNKVVSPDGLINATRPIPTSSSSRFEQVVLAGTYATNTLLTYSWYRKRITTPLVTSLIGDLDTAQNNVNLVIETANKQIESNINGFDRFEVTVKIVDGSLSSTLRGYLGSIVGIGNLSVAYFGHQYEVGSHATSYIKTVGSPQTRTAGTVSGSGSSTVINSSEGVLYFEGSALANDGTNRYMSIDDGTTSNYIYFRYVSTSNTVLMRTVVGGVVINTIQVAVADTTIYNKFAFKWKSGDYAFWINGVEVGTDTSATIFPANTLNNLGMNFPASTGGFNANTKDLRVYTTALSDAELTTLTTI